MKKDEEKKEESKSIEKGQDGQPPKVAQSKLCPLMGPGKHPCRQECSWAWVNPQDGKCVCSVSIMAAILRDMAGPIRELFTGKIVPFDSKKGPPSPIIKP